MLPPFLLNLLSISPRFSWQEIQGAVITVPATFTDARRTALENAATDAGVNVLQLLDKSGAAATTTTTDLWSSNLKLIVPNSLWTSVPPLFPSLHSTNIGGDQIDDNLKLIKFFATDFTKKKKRKHHRQSVLLVIQQ